MTKLTQESLDSLANAAEQRLVLRHILSGNHQQLCLSRQLLNCFRAAVRLIAKHNAPISPKPQNDCCIPVVAVARRKHCADYVTTDVEDGVKFEAKELSFAGLAKVGSGFSHQAHAPVTHRLTNGDRLGIYQVERKLKTICLTSRFDQVADNFSKLMKTRNPLLVRANLRESRREVVTDKLISLLQSGYPKAALHQADSYYFRISKCRLGIRRDSPLSQLGVGFQEIINKAVDFSHLIYNRNQRGRPPGAKCLVKTTFTPQTTLTFNSRLALI